MKQLQVATGIPPHINYSCAGCEQVFSSAERLPFFDRRLPDGIGTRYWCARCAGAENARRRD